MGITLGELKNKLFAELDVIPASSLEDRINDALRDIYDSNDWGFLYTDSYVRTPVLIQGTAQVSQFSKSATLDATTNTTLKNATSIVGQVRAEERQVKFPASVQTDKGFIYNITTYDSVAGVLTLDQPYQDPDNSAALIQIFKSYYTPPTYDIGTPTSPEPIIDFKHFEYIFSPHFNRRLVFGSLPELNRYDPTRIYTGDPFYVAPYTFNSTGDPVFEFYPHPRFERILRVKYLRKGIPLRKSTDQVPNVIPQALILAKCKIKMYEWALANSDKVNVKAPSKYANLIALLNSPNNDASYVNLLDRAIKADEEQYPKAYVGDFSCYPYYDFDFYSDRGLPIGETLVLDF